MINIILILATILTVLFVITVVYFFKKEYLNFKIQNIMKELSVRIYKFIEKYAAIRPDYDPVYDDEDDKYTSPDAAQMKYCADMLSKGLKPKRCWSEWGSGGYKPYTSKEGREEHDYLLGEIYKIIHS